MCSYYKEKVKRVDTNNKKQIFLRYILYIYIYMKPDDGPLWPKHVASYQQNNVLQ